MKTLILAMSAAAVLLFPLRAAAQATGHDSPKVTISVTNPTLVGTTVLKEGDYRFQCKHIDGKTFLIVSVAGTGTELLRVPCEEQSLSSKTAASELHSVVRPDGTRVLQSVRIKGEMVAHRVAD
jgi:hypothetical protein